MTTILEDAFNFKNICADYLANYDDIKMHAKDCEYICDWCERKFCNVKTEFSCAHGEYLKEAIYSENGKKYCHRDCFKDSQS